MTPLWAFDALLATSLVLLAWRSLHASTLFKAVVLFISFGLLMALAWVRLDATDIALAEAAIGAGLTGALLLDALGHVAGEPQAPSVEAGASDDDAPAVSGPARAFVALMAVAFTAATASAVWLLPDNETPLKDALALALASHPVPNAATAVLLDFRAYDTFLEMAVLALAGFGAFLLKTKALRTMRAEPPVRGSVMLMALARWLAPFTALVAFYLLWAGTARSGGAFPAGAMLGACGALLYLAGFGRAAAADNAATRSLLALGTAAFLVAGLLTMAAGRAFLDWGEGWTYGAIFALEAVLTISIGATLALLYMASAKEPPEDATGRAAGAGP